MPKTFLVAAAFLSALAAFAAPPADNVVSVPTPPVGACREAQTLVLSKSDGHVYGCLGSVWHDWTAAALAAVNVNAITGDVAVTGSVTAASFKGTVDLTTDPSYPSRVEATDGGFEASTNGGGYAKFVRGSFEAGTYVGDATLAAPNGVAKVAAPALVPAAGGQSLGSAAVPWTQLFANTLDLTPSGSDTPTVIYHDAGGIRAQVSGGASVFLGPADLYLRATGTASVEAATAVRVEAPALTNGIYTTGGTLGTALRPWPMAYASGLDVTADGTADLTTDGSGNVVLHGSADRLGGVAASGYVASSQVGAVSGVASLGSDGKVPAGQLPVVGPLTTKGDLYAQSATGAARLPVGGDGNLLLADSTQSTGLAYRSVEWIQRGTVDGVPAGIYPQSDEFNGTSVDAKWTNPCPGSWDSAAPVNGSLVLARKYNTGTGVRGIYETAPTGDFAIVFKLTSFYRFAGVGVLSALGAGDGFSIGFGDGGSGDQPTKVGQVGDTTLPAACSGGGGSTDMTLTLASGPGGYYFAVEKVGTAWSTYYSSDGVNWTMFGTTKTRPSFTPAYIAVWTYDGSSSWQSAISVDFLRVAPAKNVFGVTNWYVGSYTGPFTFTGSDLRANDTSTREGVFAANGPVKLWADQDNGAAADRHVRIYHGNKVAPQVDFDGSTNTAKLDLDSDGTTDYRFAKPAASCASGMELAIDASGNVTCKARAPIVLLPPIGSCDNGGNYARGAWSSTGSAAIGCEDVRGFYKHPYFSYPDSSSNVMAYTFLAPANWDGTLTMTLWWSGAQTSGNVRWFEGHDCFAAGSTFYNQPTTSATVDSTAAGTAYKQTAVDLTVTGLSSCAGQMTTILLGRDGTHANDTYSGAVQVNGVKLSLGAN